MNKKNRKGFTIVELVIVIAVIGILATVLVPTFGDIIDKANDSAALQEAKNIYTNYTSNFNYSTGDDAVATGVIKVSEKEYVALKASQVEQKIYKTADEAADAAGIADQSAEGVKDYQIIDATTAKKGEATGADYAADYDFGE